MSQLGDQEAAIVAALNALAVFKGVEAFTGQVFDVAGKLERDALPAAIVIYVGSVPNRQSGLVAHNWTVLIGDKTYKAVQSDARTDAYTLTERVYGALDSKLGTASNKGAVVRAIGAVRATERTVILQLDVEILTKFAAPG